MSVEILAILIGIGFGLVKKGSIYNLANLNLKFFWVLPVAYVLQMISIHYFSNILYLSMIILSYLALLFFCLLNIRYKGIPYMLAGIFLNFLEMTLNGMRMPAYLPSIRMLGSKLVYKLMSGNYGKSIVMTKSTRLPFLGDIIPFHFIFFDIVSIGDCVFAVGIGMLLYQAIQSKKVQTENGGKAYGANQ
ncbi:DUF5317 domain-containing protein [Alicyclobacillus tolerans]|uniref:DUF5317 domain-containing protein n=1 Tax=Alicyclobacillus tolerans TaxID=90970 RepID=A0ABT9LWI9_9BACL|nr:DUF5317 domain-containing protein [Alicyclobacillus tengchongensis]MDP9728627.1 hypothetical protein [Alicyclobacillus tengchongensis]